MRTKNWLSRSMIEVDARRRQNLPLEDRARGAPGRVVDVVAEAVDAAVFARRAERGGGEGGANARHRRPHHVHLRQVVSYF